MCHHGFISKNWHFSNFQNLTIFFIVLLLVSSISACTTTEKVSPSEVKTRYANLSPQQALQQTVQRYEQATSEDYDYYSPQNWQLAGQALNKSKELAKQNPDNPEIYKKLFLVDRRIDSAKYIKDRELKEFADLFEYKKILQKNNAPSSFKKEYDSNTERLARLLGGYEKVTLGSNSEAENIRTVNIEANKILNSMRALNINAVKHYFLSHDISRLQKMESSDAKNIAPVSYQQAQDALKTAYEYIEQNVHDKPGVKDISDKFNFFVSHLEHVLHEIVTLSKTDIKSLEKVVLEQEQYLLKIGQALDGVDVRNLPLGIQAESVINSANNVLNHHTEKSSIIVDLTEKNLMLEKQLKKTKAIGNDGAANAKLKGKIKLLEMDLQALQKGREKLKEDLFALQQKNIDLAIQNAQLLSTVEGKKGNVKASDQQSLGENRSLIKSDRQTRLPNTTERNQANLQR